jgi:hypothetical protein
VTVTMVSPLQVTWKPGNSETRTSMHLHFLSRWVFPSFQHHGDHPSGNSETRFWAQFPSFRVSKFILGIHR